MPAYLRYGDPSHWVQLYYSRLLGQAAGLDDPAAELLFRAAPLHDLGKIGIPDRVLLKPGPLDADERAWIRRHPEIGAEILGHHEDPLMQLARTLALTHHERWDGQGYPRGLAGEAIPLAGRIVAVADVFDALTSARPYKSAWPFETAMDWIDGERGRHFDPCLIQRFLELRPELARIHRDCADPPPGSGASMPC